ncbi:bifunctional glycosyltransferase family 2 protein/CDP-glycerol:glycerophosphate glycerophosphotransferase [Bacillaceae bacterium IKA-2]|nr:bifunctional glycosyltransferase family 2 protein/CDP-glycerol:glycerophosphate glycerophosphotransferase [Bacillaceae bacterium IKA-2]
MSKISIITPVKQDDIHFTIELYKLLLEQLYKNIEWIIIKDGNFTMPLNSENKKADFPLKIVSNQFEKGVAGARNTGIENATGDFIYFLDCDDLLSEHTLTCLAENLQKEEVDIVIGHITKVTKAPSSSNSYRTMFNRLLKDRHINETEAQTKHLRSSSLNILFKRTFLMENNIWFDTSLKLFADEPFNFAAFENADKILYEQDAFYLKKTRNDPEKNPSLHQENSDERVNQYPIAYNKAKDLVTQEHLKTILDNRLLKAYYYHFVREIYLVNNSAFLINWENALKSIEKKSLEKWKKYAVVEVKSLSSGRYTISKALANLRILINEIKVLQKKPMQRKKTIYNNLFLKLPIKNNIILYESFLGKNYSDSPKYIYTYLNEQYKDDYKHVWIFDRERNDLSDIKHKVKRFSFTYFYYLATAKYLVNNMRQPNWYEKRADQVFLQTWHGTPLKKLGMDIEEVHMPGTTTEKYKKNFADETSRWDYLVSANAHSSKVFKRAFLFNHELLEYGYPRNDSLYMADKEVYATELKSKLGIPQDKKIVLYAPTWRDDEFYGKGQYKFTLKLDLQRLKKELGDEYFFILRTHYLIADQLNIEGVEDVVYNGSKYDDIADLYLISDVLITDYSSVFFDYANLKRPILFYAYDLDKYKDTLRGFYLNHQTEWPGPILKTNDEVIKTLKNIETEYAPYQKRLEEFHEIYCKWDDGNASKNVAEQVIVKRKE